MKLGSASAPHATSKFASRLQLARGSAAICSSARTTRPAATSMQQGLTSAPLNLNAPAAHAAAAPHLQGDMLAAGAGGSSTNTQLIVPLQKLVLARKVEQAQPFRGGADPSGNGSTGRDRHACEPQQDLAWHRDAVRTDKGRGDSEDHDDLV
eukprot:CAMPEP_0181200922 /NCGR_PEP_ID=MMETSP1096-20121128/18032_1 /TAXON_ID=156174 ORGANISM="Chrysochromulina ericina, Strain CCMP281" /NCGR_SAMPLE_ID=MMETSP1096 /ASSEMBLY_ACC=CAM_ASM_000453 /LENGTH=151 /DNA_ID=CAMNT_0023291331 /DNA_START=1143 /DNA_END=1600 /DNA_ORIENTATION=-